MKTLWKLSTVRTQLLGWIGLAAACCLAGCGSDESESESDGVPVPVPDSFDAYFVTGTVCTPTNIATGTTPGTGPNFPIRFDICRHRCIWLDRTTAQVFYSWLYAAGQYNMMIMAKARANRVASETNCDARELTNPPPGTCAPETFTFDGPYGLGPPFDVNSGTYVTGPMIVEVPYLDFDQAQQVSNRVAAGESAQVVVQQVVGGPQMGRQWTVNFDPAYPPVSDGAALAGADCHPIPPP